MPCIFLSGLLLLLVAPSPLYGEKRDKRVKERYRIQISEYRYRSGDESFFGQFSAVFRNLWRFETLDLFWYLLLVATYVGVFETVFTLFIQSSFSLWKDYDDHSEITFESMNLPYLLLMSYLASLFLFHLLPRFGLRYGKDRRYNSFWLFLTFYTIAMILACTFTGIYFGEYCYQYRDYCNVYTFPLCLTAVFIAFLQELTEQHIQAIALSRKRLYNDKLVYEASIKLLQNVLIMIVEFAFIASIENEILLPPFFQFKQYGLQ